MRILVLNADYPRFLAWLYRRQPGLEKRRLCARRWRRETPACSASPISIRGILPRSAMPAAEIHVNNPWLQSAWAREHGMAVETPEPADPERPRLASSLAAARRRRRSSRCCGRWPARSASAPARRRRPRRSCSPRSRISDPTWCSTRTPSMSTRSLMRRIKAIGNPILIGRSGSSRPRGEDWSVYDLMMSQLSGDRGFLSALGVRAEVNHLAFEPAILDALPRGAGHGYRCFLRRHGVAGSPAADRAAGGRRRTLRSQTVRQPAAGAARLLAAAPLLSGRSLGRRHVSGAAALAHHAQFAYRPCRPGSRKHAAVRSHRRRRFSADRLQGQSAHAVRAGPRRRGMALGRRLPCGHRAARSATTMAAPRSRARARRRTMAQHTYRHRAAEILGFVETLRAQR